MNNKEIYEIKKEITVFHKVWKEINSLLSFNVGLIIVNITFYSQHYIVIELFVFSILLYNLYNKKNRRIYKIQFDDDTQIITLYFYQYIFFKFIYDIPYKATRVIYKHKVYCRGKIPLTLDIKQNNKFIGEIKQKYNMGWTNEEIDNIYNRIRRIKNDRE